MRLDEINKQIQKLENEIQAIHHAEGDDWHRESKHLPSLQARLADLKKRKEQLND